MELPHVHSLLTHGSALPHLPNRTRQLDTSSAFIKHGRDTTRQMRSEMPTLDVKDTAYIAGIIDGEGWISARMMKSRNSLTAQSVITVGTSSRELAEYLQRVTGTGYKGHFQTKQRHTWRPLFVWGVSS
jgi:hypothetical protein